MPHRRKLAVTEVAFIVLPIPRAFSQTYLRVHLTVPLELFVGNEAMRVDTARGDEATFAERALDGYTMVDAGIETGALIHQRLFC